MKALDVMTRTVISVEPDATVLQAARLMLQQHISGLPVIDKVGRLVGVLSEGDFLRRRETQTERRRSRWLEFLMGPGKIAAEYAHAHGQKVSEVMTHDVYTVDEDTALEDVVDLMERLRRSLDQAGASKPRASKPRSTKKTPAKKRTRAA